ncbi:uncharacterized protein N7483_011230 [Penicillium malachiteum]|uniref:uncharacterized protein n=1 Tax=Penicillium malachiteum TaxID=1324776 RepID=UPI0025470056|nr:uncharacterized protein N7483_011230 [Penicillium malachiteum]KAJ5714049.1 hypothetical protein N7483_011230 [Penicillium malachiteum]
MATTISHDGTNVGFQAGVIHGNRTASAQSETLNQACLRDLRTTNPLDDKERIKDTKGGLLKESYRWILDNEIFKQWHGSQGNRLLWIKGEPGKGKTMLLCGVIEELTRLYGENSNISYFFCQATDMRINSATSVLRGLIYLLVAKQPSILPHVQARYDYAGKVVFEDVNAWIAVSNIFRDILSDRTLRMTYLVIDALDECIYGLSSLLDLVIQESSAHPQIKWIVSSRNWPDIAERLENADQIAQLSLELNEASVSEAVNQFIQHKVRELTKAKRYSDKIRDTVERHLISNSEGTFLWVALSAKEFLLQEANNELFPKGIESGHHSIFTQSLEVMFRTLRRDIFDIKSTGFPAKHITEPSPNPLAAAEYACCYWMDHLQKSQRNGTYRVTLDDKRLLEIFLQEKYLHWLEALSILGSVSDGIRAMQRLESLIMEASESKTLLHQARDASRFIRYHKAGIESSPLQVYSSSLLFSPTKSFIREAFQKERPDWILNDPAVDENWSLCLQTLEGHSQLVNSIAWSSDGTRLASASADNTAKIWDPASGHCMFTLEGHSDSVNSIVWPLDESRLASASTDNTVKIWDPATGHCMSTLKGHSDSVRLIAWSPDGSRLASASDDNTVRVWNPTTGYSISTLEGHSHLVRSIAWSPNGCRLASASDDKTIRIWDPTTGHSISTLEGHIYSLNLIAWSPDGSRLVSASVDNTVKVWDPTTSHNISTLEGHSRSVNSIAWSPDGSRLASASDDNTIRVWDPATSRTVSALEGHWHSVSSIAWSPDGSRLASASDDNTVRIWDPATGHSVSILKGHSRWLSSITWSPNGSRLASASSDSTIRIWELAIGHSVSPLEGHTDWIHSIAWSSDGRRLASASDDNTIRIWDSVTGQSVSTFPTGFISSLEFDKANSNYLHTNAGTFDIGLVGSATPVPADIIPNQYEYGLNDDLSWITCNGLKLLWLPSDYRPAVRSLFAVYATRIAIACSSGSVIFLAFSNQCPSPTCP